MLDWLENNWEAIKEFYGDTFVYNVANMVARYPDHANTQEEFDRMNNFYTTHKGELGRFYSYFVTIFTPQTTEKRAHFI